MKIAFDAGHGIITPGKRSPNNEREWSFNNKVVLAFEKELKNYKGVELLRTDDKTGKTDVPLKARTDKANNWGADLYISFHHNAFTGKWGSHGGTETYHYKGSNKGKRLAELVQKGAVKAYGLRDRGLKTNNLHITRETKMPAVLLEGGFMDSEIDIVKLRDDQVLENAGRYIAQAVAKYLGLEVDGIREVINRNYTTYKIKNGDTLFSIAQKYNVTVADIEVLNGITGVNVIQIGETLKIPSTGSQGQSKPKPSNPIQSSGVIATIQRALNSRYGLNVAVDDIYGSETKKALVKGYQTELNKQFNAGLKVDGIFGAKTRNASVTIRKGAKGNLTWILQAMLHCLGFSPGSVDGIFGDKTEQAVRAFQRANGLSIDGVPGVNTFTRLFN